LSGKRLLEIGKVLAAILLCLSGGVLPCLSSSVVRASSEEDAVVVTTRLCGVPGYPSSTVSLSKQEYENLIRYLDVLLEQGNATRSEEEALLLFHEAVAELGTYGVLSQEMNVGYVQSVLRRTYHQAQTFSAVASSLLKRWGNHRQMLEKATTVNALCALCAVATKIPEYPNPVIIPFGILLMLGLFPALIVSLFGDEELANRLAELGLSVWMANPLRWFNYVVFEGYMVKVWSVGLKGFVFETLDTSGVFSGYTGLMVTFSENRTFFFGFAFRVYRQS
jgi:hypothetical protein